ncbi:DUF2232 domain-containing protein [bacterium]|nr:DUF2232 domain-containing protein [bacterium]
MDEVPVGIEPAQHEPQRRAWPARPVAEVVLCVVGSLVAAFLPAVGCALMVAGMWLLGRAEEGKRLWGVLACLAPFAALCVVSWPNLGSYALPSVICALACALVLPGRVSVTTVCLSVIVTSGCIAAADATVLLAMGSNLMDYVHETIESIGAQTTQLMVGSGSSVVMTAAVEQTMETLEKLWPLMYVGQGAVIALFGLLGLAVARRRPYGSLYASFLRYDVPAWGIVALIGAVVCLLVSRADVAFATTFESVGLCVLAFLRVVYFLQGLAVGMALMEGRHVGQGMRIVAVVLMLLLEASLYALSVFGVLDGLANFRRLPRHEKVVEAR